ncbi:MAG TPA: GIY-YIG nuclease family protein [Pelomicrobium sp.]|nr:GIY-YIG nuclease family protein [Pelomicrobium sp.]
MADWSLYLLRTRANALYAGIATDVRRRFSEHARGTARGAKALRGKGPLLLVYQVRIGERALALAAERRFKALAKRDKEAIVAAAPTAARLLARLGVEPAMAMERSLPVN